jgi:protein TonB
MEDRVAEILSERTALESGAAAAVVLSIVAHATLSGLAMWAAWHHTTPQVPETIKIRFAQPRPVAAAAPAPVAPAVKASAPIAKAAEPPKKISKPIAPSNFGKSSQKPSGGQPRGGQPPSAVQSVPTTTTGQPGAAVLHQDATQPDVTLEGGDFPYTVYIDRMKALIGSRWFRPQAAAITATVAFTINRDGSIRDARVETPSGNGTFDRSALRAVLESSPLPPLPFGYSGTYLGVHLTFR